MPILKVSSALEKIAMEVMRLNITILGDCPQCQGNAYRNGVCEDCEYIAEEVLAAIQAWQQSQGMKAAAARFSFADMLFENTQKKVKKIKGPCGHKMDEDAISCDDDQCVKDYANPKLQLDINTTFIGPSEKLLKSKKFRFLSPAGVKIKKQQDRLNKKNSSADQSLGSDELDDASVVSNAEITRGMNALRDSAETKFFKNKQEGQKGPDEEQEQR